MYIIHHKKEFVNKKINYFGRGSRIRTYDLLVPNQAPYQTRPHPVNLGLSLRRSHSLILACPEGFEPPTRSLEGCCSNPAELRADTLTPHFCVYFWITSSTDRYEIGFVHSRNSGDIVSGVDVCIFLCCDTAH